MEMTHLGHIWGVGHMDATSERLNTEAHAMKLRIFDTNR